MTIASSGPLTLQDIANEFGGATPHSLNEYYRGGANVPVHVNTVGIPASGAISIGDFYGKAKRVAIALVLSADTNNYDVFANRGANYAAGYTDLTLTINSGITVGSASTASYAMSVNGFTSGDTVSIVNNGTIVGAGGAGGRGAIASSATAAVAGSVAGPALYANFATSVTNNGTIAAGGGGGGGGSGRSYLSGKTTVYQNGGGGGGGAGVVGGVGAVGGNTGGTGTATTGGAGGTALNSAGAGGAGGARGTAGSSGTTGSTTVRGGAAGGGATSNYITGNSFVTWVATGTRLGNVA